MLTAIAATRLEKAAADNGFDLDRPAEYPFTEPRWDLTAILRHLAADAEHHAP